MKLKNLCYTLCVFAYAYAVPGSSIENDVVYAWTEAETEVAPSFFTRGGMLYGFSGCNRLFAPITQTRQGFRLTKPIGMTRKFCAHPAVEQAWLSLLEHGVVMKREQASQTKALWTARSAKDPLAQYTLVETGRYKIMEVAAERKDCVGVGPMRCLQVRDVPVKNNKNKTKNKAWQNFYDAIEGFEPIEGTAYRIRVLQSERPNPPADASNVRWVLDEVLEPKTNP